MNTIAAQKRATLVYYKLYANMENFSLKKYSFPDPPQRFDQFDFRLGFPEEHPSKEVSISLPPYLPVDLIEIFIFHRNGETSDPLEPMRFSSVDALASKLEELLYNK